MISQEETDGGEEEFVIPVNERDLLTPSADSGRATYCVEDGDDGADVPAARRLAAAARTLRGDATQIASHATFDSLFHVVDGLPPADAPGVPPPGQLRVEGRLLATLVACTEDLVRTVRAIEPSPVPASSATTFSSSSSLLCDGADTALSPAEAHTLRNAVKMAVFLLTWTVRKAEARVVATTAVGAVPVATGTTAGGKKKGGSARGRRRTRGTAAAARKGADEDEDNNGDDDDEDEPGGEDGIQGFLEWGTEAARERVLAVLLDVLEAAPLAALWRPGAPEEEFLALFVRTAFLCLETPAACRARAAKRCAAVVLGTLVARHGQAAAVVAAAFRLLHKCEHAPAPVADVLQTVATEFGAAPVVARAVREIARLDAADLAREGTLARNAAALLAELAERVPRLVLPAVPVLLPHLEHGESYTVRNGIVQAIGSIALHVFNDSQKEGNGGDGGAQKNHQKDQEEQEEENQDEEEEDNNKEDAATTVDTLVGVLESRILDVSSYARAKVLQTLGPLFAARAVPLRRFHAIAEKTVGRLCDRTAQVRRAAAQLLRTIVQFNPYSGTLSVELFEDKLDKCKQIFKQAELGEGDDGDDDGEMNSEEQCNGEGEGNREDEVADAEAAQRVDRGAVAALFAGTPFSALATVGDAALLPHLRRFRTWARQGLRFARLLARAADGAARLLSSHTTADVLEAVALLVAARQLGVAAAARGVRAMLALVWSPDAPVREAVVSAYKTLYLGFGDGDDGNDGNGISNSGGGHSTFAATSTTAAASATERLIALASELDPSELAALGELFAVLRQQEQRALDPALLALLADHAVCRDTARVPPPARRAALRILALVAAADPAALRPRVGALVAVALSDRWHEDVALATTACALLEKLRREEDDNCDGGSSGGVEIKGENGTNSNSSSSNGKETPTQKQGFPRLPHDHELFQRLEAVITCTAGGEPASVPYHVWAPAAEHALNAVHVLAENPDRVYERAVRRLHAAAFTGAESSGTIATEPLARLIFVAGHCVVKLLAYYETVCKHMDRATKAREALAQQQKKKEQEEMLSQKKKKKEAKMKSGVKRRSSAASKSDISVDGSSSTTAAPVPTMDGEGVPVGESAAELLAGAAERALTTTDLLGAYRPLVVAVCRDAAGAWAARSPLLGAAAALALGQYACAGGEAFCRAQMPLVATRLARSGSAGVRAALVAACGDLCARYPNATEAWTPHLFARLGDTAAPVRRNAVAVLAHLVLNDVIKLKGHMSALALCLEDPDPRVAALARLFFAELAKKGNAVYNTLPDVISALSAASTTASDTTASDHATADTTSSSTSNSISGTETPNNISNSTNSTSTNTNDLNGEPMEAEANTFKRTVTRETFRRVMEYLFGFLQKERQFEALLEKLCARFRTTADAPGLAYCLSLLTYNERCIRKLAELAPLYQHALHDDAVHDAFALIVARARKFARADMKAALDALDARISAARSGAPPSRPSAAGINNEDAGAAGDGALATSTAAEIEAEVTQSLPRTVARPAPRRRAVTTAKKRGRGASAAAAAGATARKRQSTRARTVAKTRRRRAVASSSEDEDDSDFCVDDDDSDERGGFGAEEEEEEEEEEDCKGIIRRPQRRTQCRTRKTRYAAPSDGESDGGISDPDAP